MIGFETDFHPDLLLSWQSEATPDADYVLANPPFNDSDTALHDSAFLQSEAKIQVVNEAKDNFRKDDDVRWQMSRTKFNAQSSWH